MNYKVIQKGQEDSFCMKNFKNILWPTNIEVHYTEAISKHRFRITQGDIDTDKGRDIHVIFPYLVLRRGCMNSKKTMLICFSFTYFLHIIYTFCLQTDMTQML